MADEEQLALLRQGVAEWNEWRRQHRAVQIDLTGANHLSGAHLREADMYGAVLYGAALAGAALTGAALTGAALTGAALAGAALAGADLRGADLRGAVLTGADLRGVVLRGADLTGADLTGADLSEAVLGGTIFADTDLSTAKGLETVFHNSPSTIGIDTLFRSQGRIPEVFLRGCGVPESLIEYLPSLLGAMQPIQFYSCFISYSAHDQAFAQRLYDRLQGQGLRVWFAPEELKGGRTLDEQIDTAIRTYDKLILVISDASVRSKWVMHELRKARRAELANQRRKLFPIRLTSFETLHNWECFDPENGQDLADEVRQYFIPDFAQWKDHDRFEHEFGLLLAALKAVDDPPAPGPLPEKVIANKQRELRLLRQQQATLGAHTPPHLLMKIEDIEGEIRALGGAVDE
ncbi:MAG: toll/interleukin-1 receptor domain-containing protein [Kouleothrix sp.]